MLEKKVAVLSSGAQYFMKNIPIAMLSYSDYLLLNNSHLRLSGQRPHHYIPDSAGRELQRVPQRFQPTHVLGLKFASYK